MVTPLFFHRIFEIKCFLLPLAKLQAASLFSLTMQDCCPCFSCSWTHACPWLNVKQKRDSQSNVGHLGFNCSGRVVMRLYSGWGKAVKPPKSSPAPPPPPQVDLILFPRQRKPRWPPIRIWSQSWRSYGKIGDSEQSSPSLSYLIYIFFYFMRHVCTWQLTVWTFFVIFFMTSFMYRCQLYPCRHLAIKIINGF